MIYKTERERSLPENSRPLSDMNFEYDKSRQKFGIKKDNQRLLSKERDQQKRVVRTDRH